jgi:uncharacterized protein (TIGR03067 family)
MRYRLLLGLLALLGLTAFAPAPFPKPPKDDLKRLAGVWAVDRYERGGSSLRSTKAKMRLRITGNNWEFMRDTQVTASYVATLDPKAKPPSLNLSGKPGEMLGIYRLDRDQFEMVFNHFGVRERPSSFDKTGQSSYRLVLKREKP